MNSKLLFIPILVASLLVTWYFSCKIPVRPIFSQISYNFPYIWNNQEKSDMIEYIIKYLVSLKIPEKSADSISRCIIDRFMLNLYSYAQVSEIIRRVQYGGRMSQEMWKITLECIQHEFPGTDTNYSGPRNPGYLIQQIFD